MNRRVETVGGVLIEAEMTILVCHHAYLVTFSFRSDTKLLVQSIQASKNHTRRLVATASELLSLISITFISVTKSRRVVSYAAEHLSSS